VKEDYFWIFFSPKILFGAPNPWLVHVQQPARGEHDQKRSGTAKTIIAQKILDHFVNTKSLTLLIHEPTNQPHLINQSN